MSGNGDEDENGDPDERLQRLAEQAWSRETAIGDDADAFGRDPAVAELRERLAGTPPDELAGLITTAREHWAAGPDIVLIAVCLQLLTAADATRGRRDEIARLIGFGPRKRPPFRPYSLAILTALGAAEPPLLTRALADMPQEWLGDRVVADAVGTLARRLLDAGDAIDIRSLAGDPDDVPDVCDRLDRLAGRLLAPHDGRARLQAAHLAVETATGGTLQVLDGRDLATPATVSTAELQALADEVVAELDGTPPGSVLVAGPSGSGKSRFARLVARRLAAAGWLIVEGAPGDIAAGQMYVNQLEGRLQALATAMRGRRVLWLMPDFDTALTAGRANTDPRSIADRLLPYLARGDVAVLGELSEEGEQSIARECPQLARVVRIARPPEPSDEALRAMSAAAIGAGRAEPGVLDQALDLARHLLPYIALPGSVCRLLEEAAAAAAVRHESPVHVRRDDVFAGLARLTGLPRNVVDEAERLDLEAVRSFFAERILGQPEAIDVLVERIALIKAGLTDPTRPFGTLLFVGPTGTGKTELARALAEHLFGSPEKMVRVDMSELKDEASLDRLLGTGGEGRGAQSLVSRVRATPFCVVLLDEFEKAAPPAWDLFLQVFDAGRLTDRVGRTADFRQSIVIVTSNLGSALSSRQALGFGEGAPASGGFSEERVTRAVRNALRPELVNRFDRVVVFRPLSRDVMRGIVRREIDAVFERRGLASREWAVEVDESAVDFLLDRGFTVDMGARPLARAVERHLLAPLARAIVTHQAPRGEQFLLVTADTDTLDVAFVAADPAPAAAAPDGAEGERTVRDVARDPDGSRADLHVLRLELDACRARVRDAVWEETKDAALLETARPGFWDEPDRFAILGRAEVMDRIEAQVRSGASLLDRLFALARTDEVRIDPGPVARLARELLQVRSAIGSTMADEPQDALLVVDGGAEIGKELAAMYAAWAARAGAVVHKLAQRREPYRRAFLLEGLGVHATLAPEAGVHVLERSPHRKVRRVAAAEVLVAPWPGLPGDDAAAAAAALTPATGTPVVRRYQHDPTPLVRDRVRGYRTGRIDHVLSGGFDLF